MEVFRFHLFHILQVPDEVHQVFSQIFPIETGVSYGRIHQDLFLQLFRHLLRMSVPQQAFQAYHVVAQGHGLAQLAVGVPDVIQQRIA